MPAEVLRPDNQPDRLYELVRAFQPHGSDEVLLLVQFDGGDCTYMRLISCWLSAASSPEGAETGLVHEYSHYPDDEPAGVPTSSGCRFEEVSGHGVQYFDTAGMMVAGREIDMSGYTLYTDDRDSVLLLVHGRLDAARRLQLAADAVERYREPQRYFGGGEDEDMVKVLLAVARELDPSKPPD